MLMGRCCVVGSASRTSFLHKLSIFLLASTMSGLYPAFHEALLKDGGCLASWISESWSLSDHGSTALPSSFVASYPQRVLLKSPRTTLFLCGWYSGENLKDTFGGLHTDVITIFPRSSERILMLLVSFTYVDST